MEARKWIAGASLSVLSLGACSQVPPEREPLPVLTEENLQNEIVSATRAAELPPKIYENQTEKEFGEAVVEDLFAGRQFEVGIGRAAFHWQPQNEVQEGLGLVSINFKSSISRSIS